MTVGDSNTVGWKLYARPTKVNIHRTITGVFVLYTVSKFYEDTSGEDIPEPIQSAAYMCYAIVIFLLLLFRTNKDDD